MNIPHDITMTAIDIAQSAPCVPGTDVGPLRQAIEQAIFAERERCIRIAKAIGHAQPEERFGEGRVWAANQIATIVEAGGETEFGL